tara:strand:+ start:1522 stop:1824 length:303 start_codon:yes stop_codon:yes gene_type:complete
MFSLKHFGKTKYAAALSEIERKPGLGDGGRSMFMLSDALKEVAAQEKADPEKAEMLLTAADYLNYQRIIIESLNNKLWRFVMVVVLMAIMIGLLMFSKAG